MQKKLSIKKYISLLLIAVLLLLMGISANAASKVVFTVVNDQFSDLSDSTMPIEKGGKYFVPYSVFLSGFGGIKAYYAVQEQVLVLYDKEKVISFDIAHGYTYDQQMRTYAESAFTQNGAVYVPASFVCSTWGFYYSTMSSSKGAVVRISRSTPSLSDSMLLYVGDSVMTSLLADYNKSSTGQSAPPSGETPPAEPKKIAYLTFDASPGTATVEILSALSRYRYPATFFLSAQNMAGNDDIIRQIIVNGHSIGLNASSKAAGDQTNTPDTVAAQLSSSNELLEKFTKMKTRVTRITDAAHSGLPKEMRDALYLSGYRLWDYTIDATGKNTSYSISSAVVSALKKTTRPAVIMMENRDTDAKALNTILAYLKQNSYVVLAINEWDAPINAYQDIR